VRLSKTWITKLVILLLKPLILKKLFEVITTIYPNNAADFLKTILVGKIKEILDKLKANQTKEIQRLLGYIGESIGGLMITEYITFYQDNSVEQILKK